MIISEFLPNPIGKDADGEFIELFNNESQAVNLSGWKLKDTSGKTFAFTRESIGAGEYLAIDYKTSKISLNNNGETIYLYDGQGKLIDKAGYVGVAETGRSLIRQDNQFVSTDKPTPGKPNIYKAAPTENNAPGAADIQNLNSLSSALDPGSASVLVLAENNNVNVGHLFLGIAVALILASLFIIIWKKLASE